MARLLEKYDLAPDIDLATFTRILRDWGGATRRVRDIEAELLYNRLIPGPLSHLNVHMFVRLLCGVLPPEASPELSEAQFTELLQALAGMFYGHNLGGRMSTRGRQEIIRDFEQYAPSRPASGPIARSSAAHDGSRSELGYRGGGGQHSPGTPTAGLRERGNDTSKSPAAAADRTQRPDATCEGEHG